MAVLHDLLVFSVDQHNVIYLHSVLNRELSDFFHLLGKLCVFGVYDDKQKKPYKMHFTENSEIVKKERELVRLFETYPFLG